MEPKLKVLFIAYFFPPVDGGGIPGAMRILKFLRHIDAESYVLTQNKGAALNPDPSITCDLPEYRIVRAGTIDPFGFLLKLQFRIKKLLKARRHAAVTDVSEPQKAVFADNSTSIKKSGLGQLKDFVYNLNYFPDQASCWILPALWRGRKVISERRIDVIFATGSPWSSLVLGYLLSKICRKPLIVDFRDPWINNPFHHTKGQCLDRLAEKLERKIIRHAALVSLNTEPLLAEFVCRYPELGGQKFVVLPNGFDEEENNIATYVADHTKDDLVIRHTGFLYGPRDPSVLLEAVRIVNKKALEEGLTRRWIFEQIGAVSLGYDVAAAYADMITDGSFRLLPQVSYDECQRLLKNSDLLLNIQPGTKTQVPSKIYDYLSVARPILNITPKDGALGSMVTKYQLGACFDFSEQDKLQDYLFERVRHTRWLTDESYPRKSVFAIKTVAEQIDSAMVNIVNKYN